MKQNDDKGIKIYLERIIDTAYSQKHIFDIYNYLPFLKYLIVNIPTNYVEVGKRKRDGNEGK